MINGSVHVFDVEHMLNPFVSNVPPERIFLGGDLFGLQVQKRVAAKTIIVDFLPSCVVFGALL